MALQRSTASFRRQGSSGLIWNDRFLSGEIRNDERIRQLEDRCNDHHLPDASVASATTLKRSVSDGGGGGGARRLSEITTTTLDPPSPKISVGCGFCSLFSSNRGRRRRRSSDH